MSATESSAFESKAWLKHYAEWTPTTIEYGDTTLLDFYDNNLAINSDKPAIYFFGRTQTYGEFDKHVRHAAAGLRALGVRAGDRVAILPATPGCFLRSAETRGDGGGTQPPLHRPRTRTPLQ